MITLCLVMLVTHLVFALFGYIVGSRHPWQGVANDVVKSVDDLIKRKS